MSPKEPEGWTRVLVGDIADINARSLPASTPKDYQFRYIDVATVAGPSELLEPRTLAYSEAPSRARRVVTNGDILVSTVRPYLRSFCQITDDSADLIASTGFAVLTPKDTVSGEFLYQHVLSKWFVDHLVPRMKGSNYPAVSPQDVADYSFPLPPLHEQRRIAEILSSVDEAIQATQAVIEQTRKVKQGVLKRLLTKGIGHTRFKQTVIGEIPETWKVQPLGLCFENLDHRRKPIRKEDRLGMQGDIPYYGASGVIDGVNEWLFDERLLLVAEDGANLLTKSQPIAFTISGKSYVNNHAHVLRENGVMLAGLAAEIICAIDLRGFITGTAQPKLNKSMLERIPMPVPPSQEQQVIFSSVVSLNNTIDISVGFLRQLEVFKGSLMSDLLTGRKRVATGLSMAAE